MHFEPFNKHIWIVPVEKETEASNVNQNDSELIKLLESQNEKTSNDSDKNLTLEKSYRVLKQSIYPLLFQLHQN